MIDSYFRKPYQSLVVNPILPYVSSMHPLFFTFLGFLSGIGVFISLFFSYKWSALSFLLFSGFCDTVDGSLARLKQKTSPQGAVLDIMSDRTVEFLVILGLFSVEPESRALPCLLMLGSVLLCVTSFLVVSIFIEKESEKSFTYSPGIIERAEAFIFFTLMILLPSQFTPLSIAFSILVFLTAIWRVGEFLNLIGTDRDNHTTRS